MNIYENMEVQKSLLNLFNAVAVEEKTGEEILNTNLYNRTIPNGYVLSPFIHPTIELIHTIESVVGISGEKANSAFHKSRSVVRDSSIEQLVVQQIIHYITTYGFEALGIFSNDTVYIPAEKLELPQVTLDIPFTIIKAMTKEEILEKIVELGATGIALSKETLSNIMVIIKGFEYSNHDFGIADIKNRELTILLLEYYNIVPVEPIEYLRYLVAKLTGESLLIKNKALIEKIKISDGFVLDELLEKAPINLASIFYRFKPLFLAMKSVSRNKGFFNRLRRDAVAMHTPLAEDYLNSVTDKLSKGTLDFWVFQNELSRANVFRKIRLAYALQNRLTEGNSIVYKIRNGKGWVTDFNWNSEQNHQVQFALSETLLSIAGNIRKNVEEKVFYIPTGIEYALPATEKQFTGNIPSNSYVAVPENLMLGIHWFDLDANNEYDSRVDLDLSLVDLYTKYGWDSHYRSEGREIMFSGDITSAPKPKGASEFFYIGNNFVNAKLVYVNYYNYRPSGVACKLIIAKDNATILKQNYMVNVNNIVTTNNIHLSEAKTLLGMVAKVEDETRFYFTNTSLGNGITSRNDDVGKKANEFMVRTCTTPILLKGILELAGAKVVSEIPEEGEYIDLSPEALDKTTILNLFA